MVALLTVALVGAASAACTPYWKDRGYHSYPGCVIDCTRFSSPLTCFPLCRSVVCIQEMPGISGTLVYQDNPVPASSVSLLWRANGTQVGTTTSDATGYFLLAGKWPDGDYTLKAVSGQLIGQWGISVNNSVIPGGGNYGNLTLA